MGKQPPQDQIEQHFLGGENSGKLNCLHLLQRAVGTWILLAVTHTGAWTGWLLSAAAAF